MVETVYQHSGIFCPLSAVIILERNGVKKIRRIKTNEQKNIIREMEQSSAWERDQLFAGLSQDNSA
jgi:hypothetical protein